MFLFFVQKGFVIKKQQKVYKMDEASHRLEYPCLKVSDRTWPSVTFDRLHLALPSRGILPVTLDSSNMPIQDYLFIQK